MSSVPFVYNITLIEGYLKLFKHHLILVNPNTGLLIQIDQNVTRQSVQSGLQITMMTYPETGFLQNLGEW